MIDFHFRYFENNCEDNAVHCDRYLSFMFESFVVSVRMEFFELDIGYEILKLLLIMVLFFLCSGC